MSGRYIHITCPDPECDTQESVYIGDLCIDQFPADALGGEHVTCLCLNHEGQNS